MARVLRDPRVRVWRPYEESEVAFFMWIVYDHPPEYPHYYVVRRWAVMRDDAPPIPDKNPMLANTFDEALELVPPEHRKQVDDFPDDERKVVGIFI